MNTCERVIYMWRRERKRSEMQLLKKPFYCINAFENYLTFMPREDPDCFRIVNRVKSPVCTSMSCLPMHVSPWRRANFWIGKSP